MKKKVLITVLILAVALSILFAFTLGAGAEAAEPTLSIGGKTLVMENSIYIRYLVSAENVENINDVSVFVWNDAAKLYDKEAAVAEVKTTGANEVKDGVTYYYFEFTGVAAKMLADDFYAVVYTTVDGVEYKSAPSKYSVVKYAYNMMGKLDKPASTVENLVPLLETMLDYGASAQTFFGYKTETPANADFYQIKTVGGKLADGFADGLYVEGKEVTITADAPADGFKFVGWKQGSTGEIVSADMTATVIVGTANETYTAVYEEDIPDLTAIVGKWTGSETVYYTTTEYEFVIEANKIASAKAGSNVMNVTKVAFDGTTLTVTYTIDGIDGAKTMVFTYADNALTCAATDAGNTLTLNKMVTVSIDYGTSTQADKTVEVAYGASYKLAKPSTFTGYNFKGWYINGEFVSATSAYTIPAVTEDTTAVAYWEIRTYSIKFYDQDATLIKTLTIEYGAYIPEEEVPTEDDVITKEGYTFTGNWVSTNGGSIARDPKAAVKNGMSFYPVVIDPQVPVSTLAGAWIGTETEDNSNEYYGIVNIITREYTFVIDAEGNITVPTIVVTVDNGDGDITGPDTYTDAVVSDVTFNGTVLKLTVTYNGTATKKTYSFTYDAEAKTLTKSTSFVLNSAPDLTAIAGKYTGTEEVANLNYEFVIENYAIASAKYGDFVMNIADVTFIDGILTVNYTIEGVEEVKTIVFAYDDATKTLTTESAAALNALTLTKIITVTIDYGKQGSVTTKEYAYGAEIKKPTTVGYSLAGHSLTDWYLNDLNGEVITFPIIAAEDITIVAEWTAKPYTVKFYNQNNEVIRTLTVYGGERIPADQIPTADEIITVEGFEFAGTWRTSKSGTTLFDVANDTVTAAKNLYPNMIEPQVPVSTLAGTWVGTETEDNSYPSYGITDIRTREYVFVIDAEGNITFTCVETIDDGEEKVATAYAADCVVSDVSFNGTTLKLTVSYKEGASTHKYEFTYDAAAGTLYENSYFTLTKSE